MDALEARYRSGTEKYLVQLPRPVLEDAALCRAYGIFMLLQYWGMSVDPAQVVRMGSKRLTLLSLSQQLGVYLYRVRVSSGL